MAIKTIYIGSEGPYKYDDQVDLDDPDGLFPGIKQACIVTDGDLEATVVRVVTLDAAQASNLSAFSYFCGVMNG
jgi:hypothetical protein